MWYRSSRGVFFNRSPASIAATVNDWGPSTTVETGLTLWARGTPSLGSPLVLEFRIGQ